MSVHTTQRRQRTTGLSMKGGASYSLMVTKSAKRNESKDNADIINFQVQIAPLNHRIVQSLF